ncbi:hypothetical protein [Thalassovita sp.]|uniref:hypothetical protein n=1 Tax=Thalassovita sp. TaxID=1979401 RepID=UPI003B5B6B7D
MTITAKPTEFAGQWTVSETKEDSAPFEMTVSGASSEADAIALFNEAMAGLADPVPTHAQLRTTALQRVDQEHAAFMRHLTGDATIEERDTWKTKEEAARAVLADAATPGQQAMLALEAEGRGEEVATLAATIVAKADGFAMLIGLASKLRAKARASITQATDDTVPVADVSAALDAVFTALGAQVQTAIAEWQAAS